MFASQNKETDPQVRVCFFRAVGSEAVVGWGGSVHGGIETSFETSRVSNGGVCLKSRPLINQGFR